MTMHRFLNRRRRIPGFRRIRRIAPARGLYLLIALALAGGASKVAAQPEAASLTGNAKRLLDERIERDKTVWKPEVDAQAFEQVFAAMWDRLRSMSHDFDVFKEVAFTQIALPVVLAERKLEWDIVETSYGVGDAWEAKSQFHDRLAQWQALGYRLHESEWHHSGFKPGNAGRPAESTVSFLLHAAGPDERCTLRGTLNVLWTPESTPTNPKMDAIQVVELKVLRRRGDVAFEPLALDSDEKSRPTRAQPLIVYDLDADGDCEIILGESNVVYRNLGEGRFQVEPFLRRPVGTLANGIVADFDRNGRLDFVSVGKDYFLQRVEANEKGEFLESGRRVCSTKFTRPQAFSAGDVDGDGDLDLWCGQYMPPYLFGQMPTPYYDANDGLPDFLFLNDGEGQFKDRTIRAGLAAKAKRRTYSGSLVDLDDDGDLDLVVVSDFSGVDVYRNDGTGGFSDVTSKVLPERHTFGMSHSLADYDLNGTLDLYVVGMSSTTARRLTQLGLGLEGYESIQAMRPVMGYGNRMYLDQGEDLYAIPSWNDQVARTGWSWGCSSFDFDNDGDRDLYIANGHRSGDSCQDYCTTFWRHDIYLEHEGLNREIQQLLGFTAQEMHAGHISWNGYEHNKMFMNRDGKEFVDVAWLLGIALESDCRAVVSNDLDGDGRVDLLVTEYKTRGEWETYRLRALRNNLTTPNRWIGVRLHDSAQGGSVIGAQVEVDAGDRHFVDRVVTGDSFTAQHAPVLHFGLGERTHVERIIVKWADGRSVVLDRPEIKRYHDLTTSMGK